MNPNAAPAERIHVPSWFPHGLSSLHDRIEGQMYDPRYSRYA